jgi:hypothetical protein
MTQKVKFSVFRLFSRFNSRSVSTSVFLLHCVLTIPICLHCDWLFWNDVRLPSSRTMKIQLNISYASCRLAQIVTSFPADQGVPSSIPSPALCRGMLLYLRIRTGFWSCAPSGGGPCTLLTTGQGKLASYVRFPLMVHSNFVWCRAWACYRGG